MMSSIEHFEPTVPSSKPLGMQLNAEDFSMLKKLDAGKTSPALPEMNLDAGKTAPALPGLSLDAAPTPPGLPEMNLDTGKRSVSLPDAKDAPLTLPTTDLSKISLTTPAEDASTHTQPDYYLNSEGKLIKNPLAHPSPDGKIKIEVEGNNSAKQAEQYANKLQKDSIRYLVELFKRDNPGGKVPEMWQAILDSTPDSSFPNDGDSQNNNTVTDTEQQAYNSGESAPPNLPPQDSTNPQSIPEGDPGAGAPSTAPGAGSGDGGGGSGGGGDSGGGSGGGGESSIPNQVSGNGGAPTSGLDISSGTMNNYDGDRSHMSSTQMAIVEEANKDLGRAMWGGWGGASAELGCAASVSQILNDCGAASLHNAQDDNCDGLQADLLAQGWTITDKPQPGDVWIGRGGASEAHTGIVGENNVLMDNHSSNGLWSSDSGGYANSWTNSVFLKPPDTSGNNSTNSNKRSDLVLSRG